MSGEGSIQFLPRVDAPGAIESVSPQRPRAVEGAAQTGFGETLNKAIGQLDELQVAADRQMTEVAMGGGNLHEMAIALEKANVSMRLAVKVRNKVLDAYQQVMRMGS